MKLTQKIGNMLGAIKAALLGSPSRADALAAAMNLEDEVRLKLGGGWFTRRLTARSRAARLRTLTMLQRDYAAGRGWTK